MNTGKLTKSVFDYFVKNSREIFSWKFSWSYEKFCRNEHKRRRNIGRLILFGRELMCLIILKWKREDRLVLGGQKREEERTAKKDEKYLLKE